MTINDIEDSIYNEIRIFSFLHNGAYPERIFVSRSLLDILELNHQIRCLNPGLKISKKPAKTIFGVILEVYEGEEIEFYLAERKGAFTMSETNQSEVRIYKEAEGVKTSDLI
ncbi:MAG: hypothetical protein IJO73_02415 [Clostridia bacterium]|nr:hypothetical protein [Clostridia bacterium]